MRKLLYFLLFFLNGYLSANHVIFLYGPSENREGTIEYNIKNLKILYKSLKNRVKKNGGTIEFWPKTSKLGRFYSLKKIKRINEIAPVDYIKSCQNLAYYIESMYKTTSKKIDLISFGSGDKRLASILYQLKDFGCLGKIIIVKGNTESLDKIMIERESSSIELDESCSLLSELKRESTVLRIGSLVISNRSSRSKLVRANVALGLNDELEKVKKIIEKLPKETDYSLNSLTESEQESGIEVYKEYDSDEVIFQVKIEDGMAYLIKNMDWKNFIYGEISEKFFTVKRKDKRLYQRKYFKRPIFLGVGLVIAKLLELENLVLKETDV